MLKFPCPKCGGELITDNFQKLWVCVNSDQTDHTIISTVDFQFPIQIINGFRKNGSEIAKTHIVNKKLQMSLCGKNLVGIGSKNKTLKMNDLEMSDITCKICYQIGERIHNHVKEMKFIEQQIK